MRGAYVKERRSGAGSRTEALRGLEMLDRDVGLARPIPEHATDQPAPREVRVERQRTISQRRHGPDVLAEISQREGGIRQSPRIIAGQLQGSFGEIDTLQTVRLRIFAPTVNEEAKTAECGPGEC
jgi:hypothetical protein